MTEVSFSEKKEILNNILKPITFAIPIEKRITKDATNKINIKVFINNLEHKKSCRCWYFITNSFIVTVLNPTFIIVKIDENAVIIIQSAYLPIPQYRIKNGTISI